MNEVSRNIEQHLPALRRYALSLARNPSAADDLVQECAVRALSKAHLFRPGTRLREWLFTILHNLYISETRRARTWKQPADPEAALAMLSVPPSQPGSAMLRAVNRAMTTLPQRQRRILLSVAVDGKAYDEISRELDIPVGTVKSRCFRARAALQRQMSATRSTEARVLPAA